MATSSFNFVPQKKSASKKLLPVVSAVVELFVCIEIPGLSLTRNGCKLRAERDAANPNSMGPCRTCFVGDSHRRGREPATWPNGAIIETKVVRVRGGGAGPNPHRHPTG